MKVIQQQWVQQRAMEQMFRRSCAKRHQRFCRCATTGTSEASDRRANVDVPFPLTPNPSWLSSPRISTLPSWRLRCSLACGRLLAPSALRCKVLKLRLLGTHPSAPTCRSARFLVPGQPPQTHRQGDGIVGVESSDKSNAVSGGVMRERHPGRRHQYPHLKRCARPEIWERALAGHMELSEISQSTSDSRPTDDGAKFGHASRAGTAKRSTCAQPCSPPSKLANL